MTAWYNEIDDYAANWLENLIAAGEIAPGVVDRRSIEDVRPDELLGFTQCHFFAGIGVWSAALRSAGWPDNRRVWTGSCPCQSFSAAGKGAGFADERHLWPAWFHLISQCRPDIIYGEQVSAAINHGWLDLVYDDLQGENYALWSKDFPACGVGAPHIRQRLWFTAEKLADAKNPECEQSSNTRAGRHGLTDGGNADILVNAVNAGLEGQPRHGDHGHEPGRIGTDAAGSIAEAGTACNVEHTASNGREQRRAEPGGRGVASGCGTGGMADAHGRDASAEREQCGREQRFQQTDGRFVQCNRPGPTNGFWRNADWLGCRDGKWRPTRPGTSVLVDGSAFRVDSGSPYEGKNRAGMLKGFGNAIVKEAAQAVIESYLECRP